jgi:MFS family permease
VGPLLSIQILEKFDFTGIFILSLLTHFLIFSFLIIFIRETNHKFREKETVTELVKKVFKRPNVRKVYYLSFALEFFYALMVIYTPLYLLEKGFSWEQLGVAFTIMLVPFVLIQYPAGLFADKKTGEKELLFLAFFLMGTSTLMFYFIDSPDIMIWTTVLLLTRIGAALVETLRESYFYKRIDGNDIDLIDFFKTSKPVAFILAMASSAIVLTFFSMKAIFLLAVVVSFSALWPTFRLVDNKSEKEIEKCGCN